MWCENHLGHDERCGLTLALRHGARRKLNMKPARDRAVA